MNEQQKTRLFNKLAHYFGGTEHLAGNDKLQLCSDKYAVLNDCHALVICTEWQQFRAPDFDQIALRLNNKVIIDGSNLYSPERLEKDDWAYHAIGRGRSEVINQE